MSLLDPIETLRRFLQDPEETSTLGAVSDSWIVAEQEDCLEAELEALGGGRPAQHWAYIVALQLGITSLASQAIDILGPLVATRAMCEGAKVAAPRFRWAMA